MENRFFPNPSILIDFSTKMVQRPFKSINVANVVILVCVFFLGGQTSVQNLQKATLLTLLYIAIHCCQSLGTSVQCQSVSVRLSDCQTVEKTKKRIVCARQLITSALSIEEQQHAFFSSPLLVFPRRRHIPLLKTTNLSLWCALSSSEAFFLWW